VNYFNWRTKNGGSLWQSILEPFFLRGYIDLSLIYNSEGWTFYWYFYSVTCC